MQTYRKLEAENNKENLPVQPTPLQPPVTEPSPRRRSPAKKRRFIDTQPNPERLTWNSQESQYMPAENQRSPIMATDQTNNRRPGDAGSSDEDFQQDTREIARPQRSEVRPRPTQLIAGPRPSAKRPREVRERRADTGIDDLEEALVTHNADPPAPSQVEVYQQVNSYAKERTAMRPKKVQVRTPWSAEETERLIDLIGLHGLSWSRLKKMDEHHVGGQLFRLRDQIGLKDKARNLKLDYLK